MVSGLKDDHNRSVCVDGAELGRGRSRSAMPLGGSGAYSGPAVGWNARAWVSPHCQPCVAALKGKTCPWMKQPSTARHAWKELAAGGNWSFHKLGSEPTSHPPSCSPSAKWGW